MAFASEKTVTDVVTDFPASAPTVQEVITFRLHASLQERAHWLLDKNHEGSMTLP